MSRVAPPAFADTIAAMANEDYRRASYEIWQAMAAGWDSRRSWIWEITHTVSEKMLEGLRPQPGQTILELAAGTGETGFAAAEAIGPDGHLISTDFAPDMVDAARRESERLGLENVDCRIMDAERMDLDDDSVDGVLCRYGYMLMADPAAALAETRRVLRDGGRLSFAVFGPPEENPWASIPGKAVMEHSGAPPPDPEAPGIFAMASRDRIRSLVTGAGFGEPAVEEVEVRWRFDGFDDYWAFLMELAGAISMVLKGMPGEDREAVRGLIEGATADLRKNGQLELPGITLQAAAD